jgi:hypothetical protein
MAETDLSPTASGINLWPVLEIAHKWASRAWDVIKVVPVRHVRLIWAVGNFVVLLVIASLLGVLIQGARYYVVAQALSEHAAYRHDVDIIYKKLPALKTNAKAYIAKEDAELYVKTDQDTELGDAVFRLLNHYEQLSVLYSTGLADSAAFEDSFKDMLGRAYGRLQGWLEAYRDYCGCSFDPFERLGKRWMPTGQFTERVRPN